MEDEARFPFDIKNFQKAVDSMAKSVSTIQQKMDGFGKTMTQSVSKAIKGATAQMALLVKGFKSVMGSMPEIGQAFKLASGIISREFFYPIRQKIIPYLQKMLDWTRDHRTLFAKWGQAVADTLGVVIVVAKSLWSIFKDLTKMLVDTLQRSLKTSFNTLDEFVAVLQVKVAFAMLLMGEAIKKLAETVTPTLEFIVAKGGEVISFLGQLAKAWTMNGTFEEFGGILENIYGIFDKIARVSLDGLVGFFEGLLTPLQNLSVPLGNLKDAFQSLLDIVGLTDEGGLRKALTWIGDFVGNVLYTSIEGISKEVKTVVGGFADLIKHFTASKELGDGFSKAMTSVSNALSSVYEVFKKLVKFGTDGFDTFFSSLIDPLKNLTAPLNDTLSSFTSLTNAIGSIIDTFKELLGIFGDDDTGIRGAFSWLGNFLGNVLTGILGTLITHIGNVFYTLKGIGDIVGTLIQAVAGEISWGEVPGKMAAAVKDVFTHNFETTKEQAERVATSVTGAITGGNKEQAQEVAQATQEALPPKQLTAPTSGVPNFVQKQMGAHYDDEVNDGIVTKDGKVIHLNPDDNVYAFKDNSLQGNSNNVSVEMRMVFNVQATEGDAKAVGVQLGQSIHDSFVDRLKKQMMTRGY